MGRLSANEIANAAANYNGTAAATPAYEAPTPTPAADYGSYQDNTNNPYDANNNGLDFGAEEENKNKGQEALEQASTESQKPAQPEQPKQSFSQESLNNVLTQNGVTAEEWSRITNPNFDIQGLMSSNAPEAQKYRNAYMAYQNMMQTPAQQTPAPTQAPAQTPAPAPAPAQNPILPSAGGNYQADEIYDPSKTYGRQADGSYVYSSSAAQLQRDLNRVMNAGLAVDGYFGEKTQQALNEYLAQNGKPENSIKGDESYKMYDAPIGPTFQQPESTTTQPATTPTPEPQTTSTVNGRHYEGVGNKAENPEKVAQEAIGYTMNTASAPTEGSAYWDANREPVYSSESPNANGETSYFKGDETPIDPYIAELERANQIAEINNRGRSMDNYYRDMLDNMQSQPEERQSMAGNSMSAALGNYKPDERAAQHYQDNYDFLYSRGGQVKDGVTLGLGKTYWEDAEPTRDDQYYENLYRSGETPASLYQRHEGEDNAYKYSQNYENWLADRGLTDYGYGVAESWQHGGQMDISENSPGARSGAYADANRPEVHYGDTRSTTPEDAEQLALYDELENLYRSSVADPHAIGASEAIASDDVQSSNTTSSEEQAMREAYANAMQSAGRARDIFNGLPTEAEQMQQAREQREQNMRTALENQFNNPYMQQFQRDFEQLKQQFPNYSNTALMDMILVNEEMRNGQSSYYKWLANSL